MNALSAYGKCCCNQCQVYTAPAEAESAFPWDCMTVQLIENSLILRRCCSVTTPLLAGMGGYSSSAVVPYYQPSSGPPITDGGAYSITSARSLSLRLGVHDENTYDCTGSDGLGGSYAYFDGFTCWRSSNYSAEDQIYWLAFGVERPAHVSVTSPDENGHRYAIYEDVASANGEVGAPGYSIHVFNMNTGANYAYKETTEAFTETTIAAGTYGSSFDTHITGVGHGHRLMVGPNSRIMLMRIDTPNRRVVVHKLPFDKSGNGRWITTEDPARVIAYDYTSGITPVAWQLDNNEYYLEIERIGGKTRIYRNGPFGRKLLIADAPSDCVPFCYQRHGKRHVFLAITSTSHEAAYGSGSRLYDVTEGGGVSENDTRCGTPNVQAVSGAYWVSIGARGELLTVDTSNVSRLGADGWSQAHDGVSPWASITRPTWYGWYHVRGALYTGSTQLYNAHNYQPNGQYFSGISNKNTYKTRAWMIHPDGPSSGVTVCRQYSPDNSSISVTPPDERPDGTEIVQFSGNLYLGEFDSFEDIVVAAPDRFAAIATAGAETPSFIYSDGVQADPSLPAYYGPGASAAF